MNKYIFLIHLAFAVILSSCSNYDTFEPTLNTETLNHSRLVSLDEASAFVDKIISPSLIKSRGDNKQSPDYDIIPVKTKSGLTVMYIVNFGKDEGFMILSADKESKTILAINETGSISNNWSNISFNQWIKETSEEIEKSLNLKYSLV